MTSQTGRGWLHIFYIQDSGGTKRAAFFIDGRTYSSEEETQADIIEAHVALDERRIIGFAESSLVGPTAPKPQLPTWKEYKELHFT